MDGLTLKLGGREIRYFPAGEPIPDEEPVAGLDRLEDRLLADHPRLRRFLIRPLPSWPLSRYCLHWSDGADLTALDRRVAAGGATEQDFAEAVVGEVLGMNHPDCGAALRVVALNPTLPLFADLVERSRRHGFRRGCPVCGGPLNASVLEFLPPEPTG